jgi:hypothetical protein
LCNQLLKAVRGLFFDARLLFFVFCFVGICRNQLLPTVNRQCLVGPGKILAGGSPNPGLVCFVAGLA